MTTDTAEFQAAPAIPVARGCGKRKPGGIYAECGMSGNGMPLEHFICDPPIPLDGLAVSSLGIQLIEKNGVWHILDVVGACHYPNVADFLEEVRRFGLSRRLGNQTEFAKLGPNSRIILAHPRAWVGNAREYPTWDCPTGKHKNRDVIGGCEPDSMCAGVWWHDLDPAEEATPRGVRITQSMPSFTYKAHTRPAGIKPQYKPAIFASFPLSRLVVVGGSDKSGANLDKARAAKLTVDMVGE